MWVGLKVCPKAEEAEEHDNRDIVSEGVEAWHVCAHMRLGPHGETLGVDTT